MAGKQSINEFELDTDDEDKSSDESDAEKEFEKRPTDEERKLTRKRLEDYFERKQLRKQIDYDPLADNNDELGFEEEEEGEEN